MTTGHCRSLPKALESVDETCGPALSLLASYYYVTIARHRTSVYHATTALMFVIKELERDEGLGPWISTIKDGRTRLRLTCAIGWLGNSSIPLGSDEAKQVMVRSPVLTQHLPDLRPQLSYVEAVKDNQVRYGTLEWIMEMQLGNAWNEQLLVAFEVCT